MEPGEIWAANGMNDEDYDAINAPQFLDFSLLGLDDDDEADRFFETHKEEDDHFVPAENLSPTIQLMRESDHGSEVGERFSSGSTSSSNALRKIEAADESNFHSVQLYAEQESNRGSYDTFAFAETTQKGFEYADAPLISLIMEKENQEPQDNSFEDENKENQPDPSLPNVNEQPQRQPEKLQPPVALNKALIEIGNIEEHEIPKKESPVKAKSNHSRISSSPARKFQNRISEAKQFPRQDKQVQVIKNPMKPLISKYTTKITVPQPFNLHQTRPRTHVETKPEQPEPFKARPIPTKTLQGPVAQFKSEAKVTEPKSPHFASEDRIRARKEKKPPAPLSLPSSPMGRTRYKSGPASVASSSNSYRPPTPKKVLPPTPTRVKPFSFAERDEERLRKKELKIKEELEKKIEHYAFHAKPLPSFKSNLPPKPLIEVTHIEPFKLHSDERGAAYRQAWKSKIQKEEEELKVHKIFRANPPTVLYKKPFEPVLGMAPLSEPLDIQLNSDKRAKERQLYEAQMREKHREEEEQRQMDDAIRRERERKEEIEHRKQLVHKANPLRPFRVFQVKSSDKPLTNPHSPAFAPMPSQRRIGDKGKYPSDGSLNTAL